MAHDLAVNAKTHRFGVCNAVETILVHEQVAAELLPRLAGSLDAAGVEIRGDERVRALLPSATPATEDDFASEFLAPVVAMAGGRRGAPSTTSPATARVTPRRS